MSIYENIKLLERMKMEIFEKNGAIYVKGTIKTLENIENIKKYISDKDYIELIIEDSFAMPSALIGYLIKLKQKDKKQVVLKIGNDDLYELLMDLGLLSEFNVMKI
jgi:uncharacterized protein YcsI (UPF0317 family)